MPPDTAPAILAALAFILDCQTGDGGFARAPDALPDIALTHLALAGLDALAGVPLT
jgi:prenyltransferase beta subunit